MSESLLVLAFWMGIVSACSLPLGTLTTLVWRPDDRSVGILLAFGGGTLLAALTIDLVGSALARGEFAWLAMGCVFGGILFVVLDNTVNNRGGFLRKSSTVVQYLRRKHRQRFRHALDDLERIALFDDLRPEHAEDLAAAAVRETFAKGATIYSAGDPSDFLYIVDDGEVSVTDPRSRGRIVAVHTERGTPGQHAFLTGIGAALGSEFFVEANPHAFAIVEGVAAGAMLTLIAQTMAPEAYLKAGPVVGLATLMGFLAAIFCKTLE